MKKFSPKQMKSIQKKAIKDVRIKERKSKENSSFVSTENGLILFISSSMKDMLKTETFVYQNEKRHKFNRFPKIRRISNKRK